MSADLIINHDEARHLATLRAPESNLARCYLEHVGRIAELEDALRLAVEWGVASKGCDGGMARSLRQWIDDGMTGPLPAEPDWLRDMRATVG